MVKTVETSCWSPFPPLLLGIPPPTQCQNRTPSGTESQTEMCQTPTHPSLPDGAETGTAAGTQTLVVECPEEGVAVRALKQGILDLHLPPAQLLAASKPLGQREDALTLFHLLLDGMEPVLRGLRGRSQPRALEDRHSFAQAPDLHCQSPVTYPEAWRGVSTPISISIRIPRIHFSEAVAGFSFLKFSSRISGRCFCLR